MCGERWRVVWSWVWEKLVVEEVGYGHLASHGRLLVGSAESCAVVSMSRRETTLLREGVVRLLNVYDEETCRLVSDVVSRLSLSGLPPIEVDGLGWLME